ncbi:MFS general substrate transporter, partial [Aureobasidium melanogenum]
MRNLIQPISLLLTAMSAEKDPETVAVTNPVHVENLPEKVARHTAQIDDEVARYAAAHPVEIDASTNRKLFWKINRRILVVMVITYFCQSLDKGTLNFASIMGIQKDANLKGQEYSWLGTILYMGILAGEYPQNFLLQKFPLAKLLSINVFCWGTVVACSAATKSFGGLMAVRFLLGFFESCIQPTMMLLTSMWYTREEQPLLNAIWYCQSGVSLMCGGLIAFGVSHFNGHAIYSWQLLFLVLGAFTVIWAVCICWILPDSPMKAKCYHEDDKRLMIERVRHNETGIQNRHYKKYQVVEALTDPFVWTCVLLIIVANLIIGGLGVFSNLIIKQFGFTTLQTDLLNIAQGAITIMIMIGSALLCQKTQRTCLIMLIFSIPGLIGTAVIIGVKPTKSNAGGLLIAFYCTQFFLAQGNMIISLITRNVAGQTKKGICMTMTFIGWAAGNMTAPQIFQSSDAPRYIHGFIAHIVIYVIYMCIVACLWTLLIARNKKKRSAAAATLDNGQDVVSHDLAFADLTDKENPNFRYVQ